MNFRTIVNIPKPDWSIQHSDKLLLLGSCFADNIGERLTRAGIRAITNPFGTLYNPASVAEVLTRLLDERPFGADELQQFGAESWGSWMSHSLLSRPTKEEALTTLNENLHSASQHLREANVLILTFGTAWVYRLTETGAVVANCHHEPASRFSRECLTTDEIVAHWHPLLERLHAMNPTLRILFTVSPIRHLRDGAHANQLSKATLLLAQEKLMTLCPNTDYFPAYEIVLDELRDYRFFADDMAHPSSLAIDYLWERFSDTFFDIQTRETCARVEEISRALAHRPLHPESDEFRRFHRQLQDKIATLKQSIPYLNL